MKKKIIITLFSIIPIFLFSSNKFFLINGSNIYVKIFSFYFPLTKNINSFFQGYNDKVNLELSMKKDDIINEPKTPHIFNSDLIVRIHDIPLDFNGNMSLPIIVRHNKNISFKNVEFTIFRKGKILILYGKLDDLKIAELSYNNYFKNRFRWKYPLYFDLRIQIN